MNMRIGFGYDVHRFAPNRRLIIGGIDIPHEKGLLGHSDADVLLHAIIDAFLGALALGDIGTHYPDTDKAWKDADSSRLLADVVELVNKKGYTLVNLDATVVAERPKLLPYIEQIRRRIAEIIGTDLDRVSVKATTSEKMGFIGREEGVAAMVTVLIAGN